MAKEFPVTFFYDGAAHTAKVIVQKSDEETKLSIKARDAFMQKIFNGEDVVAHINPQTGELKDREHYNGKVKVIESIVEAIRLHEQNKRPVGLWS